MADNYLITGYWGEPHVTAENDRGINAAMFGTGRFVLPVGEQFQAEYIGNNTIRMYDGKLMDNGAAAGIPVGEYVDLLIANAGQGKKRNDLIVFQYSQDASTLIESGVFTVIQGTESSGTASDPALTQADLLSGEAAFDQMALWRVPVSGTTISAPVKLFSVSKDLPGLKAWAEGELARKAPTGYGLGVLGAVYTSDINTCTSNGWYYTNESTLHVPHNYFKEASVFVMGRTTTYIVQKLTSIAYRCSMMRYTSDGGATWVEEWVEPPMAVGVEYRTAERFEGKPVYAKLVDFGALPNATYKTLSLGIVNGQKAVYCQAITSSGVALPYVDTSSNGVWSMRVKNVNAATVTIETSANYSTLTAYVFVKYTKTTD